MAPPRFILLSKDIAIAFIFFLGQKNCKKIFLCMKLWYKHKDPSGNAARGKMVYNVGGHSYHQHGVRVQLLSIISNPVSLSLNLNCLVLYKPTHLSPPFQSLMTLFWSTHGCTSSTFLFDFFLYWFIGILHIHWILILVILCVLGRLYLFNFNSREFKMDGCMHRSHWVLFQIFRHDYKSTMLLYRAWVFSHYWFRSGFVATHVSYEWCWHSC